MIDIGRDRTLLPSSIDMVVGEALGVLIGPLEARRKYHLSDGVTLCCDLPTPACNKIDEGWMIVW